MPDILSVRRRTKKGPLCQKGAMGLTGVFQKAKVFALCVFAAGTFVLYSKTAAQNTPPVHFGKYDVRSIFFIAKSENRNQVHYAIRATSDCRASSVRPVWAYWRNLELGPRAVSPLLPREERAYGLEQEQRIAITRTHTIVDVRLRAIPSRAVRIQLSKGNDGSCEATATMKIDGKMARLARIFVQVRTFLGIPVGAEYLLIEGRGLTQGERLREKVSPP